MFRIIATLPPGGYRSYTQTVCAATHGILFMMKRKLLLHTGLPFLLLWNGLTSLIPIRVQDIQAESASCGDVLHYPFCNLDNGARLDSSHFRDGVHAWLSAADAYLNGETSVVIKSTFQKKTFKKKFSFPVGLTLEQFRTAFISWYATSYQVEFEGIQDESAYNGEDIPSAVLGAVVTSYFATTADEVRLRLGQYKEFTDQQGDAFEKAKLPYQPYWRMLYLVTVSQLGGGEGHDRRSHTQFQNKTANLKNSNTGDLILYFGNPYPVNKGHFGFDILNEIELVVTAQ